MSLKPYNFNGNFLEFLVLSTLYENHKSQRIVSISIIIRRVKIVDKLKKQQLLVRISCESERIQQD
jgi:hypothetical protein